ncbi:MAG: hypothetical protein EBX41_01440 [Chitinophagia bacterium]|nr:hypothetical protein [Chitinophagia bacterium]
MAQHIITNSKTKCDKERIIPFHEIHIHHNLKGDEAHYCVSDVKILRAKALCQLLLTHGSIS